MCPLKVVGDTIGAGAPEAWIYPSAHTPRLRGGRAETRPPTTQQPKMDIFTTPTKIRTEDQRSVADNPGTDRFAEILDAIQASRRALEGQIGGVQAEVGLVRQDLQNVVDGDGGSSLGAGRCG